MNALFTSEGMGVTQVTEWLHQTFGEPTATYVSWALALLIVLVLIVIVFQIWRAFSGGGFRKSSQQRLGITAAHAVDNKRRLVVVRRDNVEHLIMIGGPNDILIESGFAVQAPAQAQAPGQAVARAVKRPQPVSQTAAALASAAPAQPAQQPASASQQSVAKPSAAIPPQSPSNDSVKVTRDMDQLLNEIAGDVRK